jgi:hypothetical protein
MGAEGRAATSAGRLAGPAAAVGESDAVACACNGAGGGNDCNVWEKGRANAGFIARTDLGTRSCLEGSANPAADSAWSLVEREVPAGAASE